MAKTNYKFGVVHGSTSQLKNANIEEGKLYFLSGEADGVVKQGIYGVNPIAKDTSSTATKELLMFGTGAVADGNGYGLSQANFTTEEKTKLQGLSNYTLPDASNTVLGGIKTNYIQNDKNYAVKVDSSGNAYVNVPWIDKPTNASHADSATNASTAEKVANTFDISVGGSKKLTYDGSINKTLVFKGQNIGVNASTNNNVTTITIDASNLLTKSAFEASLASLEGALTYEGAVNNSSELPTNLTEADKGKVYIASAKFEYEKYLYEEDEEPIIYKIEVQDMFIWDGAKWNIIDGQDTVENLSARIEYGEEVSIATVDGVNITLQGPTMPILGIYTTEGAIEGNNPEGTKGYIGFYSESDNIYVTADSTTGDIYIGTTGLVNTDDFNNAIEEATIYWETL